jgi:IS5 family transposase
MREAQVNLAIRWFAGFGMNDRLPDHSSLTRIRQRWGVDRFRKLFARIVRACAAAGLAPGEVVHIDVEPLSRHRSERQWRRLIRADVSFDALVERHLDAVDAANLTGEERLARTTGKFKKVCSTDPDATMATNSGNQRLQPAYKQHTAVDDANGVIVDVEVVTGEEHDIGRVAERLDAIAETLGRAPGVVTADAAYGTGKVYAALAERGVEAVIPHRPPTRRSDATGFPVERFRYDVRADVVRCPRKRILTPRTATKAGRWFRARHADCAGCPLRARCIPGEGATRRVHIATHYAAILRGRRKRRAWGERERALYVRHRWRVEGTQGTAKTLHGLARAIRRGLANIRIQALLTATAINLKRLAKVLDVAVNDLLAMLFAARTSAA